MTVTFRQKLKKNEKVSLIYSVGLLGAPVLAWSTLSPSSDIAFMLAALLVYAVGVYFVAESATLRRETSMTTSLCSLTDHELSLKLSAINTTQDVKNRIGDVVGDRRLASQP